MTIAKQLALVLVKEIIADKRQRQQFPDYALHTEINKSIQQALNELVHDGTLVYCQASVNKIPAFQLNDNV